MADYKMRISRDGKSLNNQDENYCVFNVISVFISLVTILADLTTDILVFVEYCKDGYLDWALITMTFIITPNILINIFSIRWFVIDKKLNFHHWLTHGFLVGLLERYIIFLYEVFSCKNFELLKSQKLLIQRNDLSLLHFLYVFTGTIPQIILQTHAIVMLNENYYTKVFSLTASIASVTWGVVTYIYSITSFTSENINWISLMLKLTWHFGTLVGRISGIFLFSIVFGVWTLIPLGLHWSAMTFWIITQKTTFCPNKFEETLYNAVMGFVYCFCFINVKEGHTRYRLVMFYTLIVTQNMGSMLLYILLSEGEKQRKPWAIASTSCVVLGTVIGMAAMIVYYRYFHSKGPIPWRYVHGDVELNNKVICDNTKDSNEKNSSLNNLRSFKNSNITKEANNENEKRKDSNISQPVQQQTESDNADKKFLLDHWIARAGSPTFTSAPVGNISMDVSSIELYTVENTPQTITTKHDSLIIKPKKKICSPTELTLKLSSIDNLESSIDEITSNAINIQKRRGICSSDELRDNFNNLNLRSSNMMSQEFSKVKTDRSSELSHDTDGSNKKTSSDSIDMDLDLSFSDINSSDINTFNENIVQKLCLSALKNIKVGNQDADIENIQRIALDILKEMYTKKDRKKNGISSGLFHVKRDLDTPTEILSVHDYENICAVNIAREAWGLRSWNGYCDIENWMHDGSVVRDRSRDTFTSESSEISSCLSQELKNAILSVPPFPRKTHTYSNVFVKMDRNPDDYANTVMCQTNDDTVVIKSYIIENKDPNHLEPILEELDDLGDIDPSIKKRLNSESSLVATIDEIRKATVTNSPRNLYHRRENTWESPQFNNFTQSESNLKKALWKEPSKFDPSNIMDSLTEKEIALDTSPVAKLDAHKKDFYNFCNIPENSYLTNSSNLSQSTPRRKSSNSLKSQNKKNNSQSDHLHDISNKNIDLLWQLVSENSSPPYTSSDNFSLSRKTPSLQSLIQKESSTTNTSMTKNTNIKKGSRNKPRRKFSILREKFEPKLNSDEETLCRSDNNLSSIGSNHLNPDRTQKVDSNIENGIIFPVKDSLDHNIGSSIEELHPARKQIREKRSIFMKQVLSPPKFNTKLRHKI